MAFHSGFAPISYGAAPISYGAAPVSYGAPFTGFNSYPTAFAAAPAQSAAAAEGSQAEEAASQHGVSVSGFGAPIQGGFYGFPQAYGAIPQATFIGGAPAAAYGQTFVQPGATILPSTLVPVAAPRVRRPGYNERLVAWRNRQKAFNRYKKATKEAIKNANRAQYGQWEQQAALYGAQPTVFGAPQHTIIGGAPFGAAPYGSTFIGGWGAPAPYLLPYAGEAVAQDGQQQEYAQEFSNYSASAQQEVQQEEPEIRGTQV